jgi:YbbR domain-containing protein
MAWRPFRNLWLKVVALALGTLLWFTVSGQQVERTVPLVPVVYQNVPEALEITDQTEAVSVHVRGVDSQVSSIQPGQIELRVDLTGAKAGSLQLPLRTDQVVAPFGVEVTQVDPGTVTLTLEKAGSAVVEVRPTLEGEPAAGFVMGDVTVEPSTVVVVGPERRLRASTYGVTDRVSIEGARTTVTQTVNVGVADAELRLREPRLAKVTVRIEPAGNRTMAGVLITFRDVGPGHQLTADPEMVSITARGPNSLLSALDPATLLPYVDVAGLGPGVYVLPVRAELPDKLSIAAITPASVSVRIR